MKIALMTVLVVLIAVPVFAQEMPNAFRRYEIGWNLLSYSRQGSLNLYGGDLSFTAYPIQRFGITADVAIHQTSLQGTDVTTTTYRFGPKFVSRYGKRASTFAEALFGGTRLTGSTTSLSGGSTTTTSEHADGFALAIGSGVDIAIRPWIAVRAVQVDYSLLHFSGITSNGLRVGGGLVFRFGQ